MSNKNSVDTKSPDSFQVSMYRLIDWTIKNKNLLLGITVPVIAVVIGLIAWQTVSSSQSESRRYELAVIDDTYSEESEKLADKRSSLQEEIDKLSEDKAAKTKNQAKVEKLEKELEALSADRTKSLAMYKAFMEKNMGKVEGLRAGVSAANIEVEMKNYTEAKSILEKVLAANASGAFFSVQVRLMYANLLEETGDKESAVAQLNKVLVEAPDLVKPKVMFAKGRILKALGKEDEANKVLEELRLKFPTTQEARKASALSIFQ